MKKLLGVLLTAMVVVCLTACGKTMYLPDPVPSTGSTDEKVYTYNTYTTISPSNWNELTYQDNNDTQIMGYIGSSFFTYDYKFDAEGNIVPGEYEVVYSAATKLEDVSAQYVGAEYGIAEGETARAYKITLRDDLKWDNGDPIKAKDFVYTMKQQLDPKFWNYRADSFYTGALEIVNAKNYIYQGSEGTFSAPTLHSTYSEDLDDILVFTLGNTVAKDEVSYESESGTVYYGDGQKATVALRDYMGFPDYYTASMVAQYLVSYYTTTLTVEQYAALEGKTFAEIKADPALKETWDTLYGWWHSEPNEELHFFICDGAFPAMDFENVGIFVGDNENEIVVILAKALELLNDDGSLSYKAAYNFGSLPLVHEATYEANKVAPVEGSELWTSTYNSSVDSTRSWGAYKLESFQAGKQYVLTRNTEWYGYSADLYQDGYATDRIVCETIEQWNTAWQLFLAGEVDSIGIDVSIADDYKNSARAYYTPDDFVASLQLQSSKEALKGRESEGVNKTILAYTDFRKALSLSIDRAEFAQKTTTSSLAGYGLYNSMHYYDVANGGVYRNTDPARQVLCDVYAVDPSNYGSLAEAEQAITGYNLTVAKELVEKAYADAKAAGDIKDTDKVVITLGTGAINETVTRRFDFIKASWTELVKGTVLEGRLEFEVKDFQTDWAETFRAGGYDVCMGGWTGAAWDPGYFLLAYLSPDYMYSAAWDTSAVMMTFTMPGVGENGADVTDTMSLMDWYDCLNGNSGCKYNWSTGKVEEDKRLLLIAALEKEVLSVYYTVPLYNSFGASLMSYKMDYISYEYNTFMGYGGMRYLTYNYDDATWANIIAENDGELNYKG